MEKVRISVANLATRLIQQESGAIHYFGIKPKNRIQALGGAAQLTQFGKELLMVWYEADQFEFDPDADATDARFVIEEDLAEQVLSGFERLLIQNSLELDPTADIRHELSGKEFPNVGKILSEDEVVQIAIAYHKTIRQPLPEGGRGTSSREKEGTPTRRLFRLYDIIAPNAIVSKILASAAVRELTLDELATTQGGSRKGMAADGTEIADNLFLVP